MSKPILAIVDYGSGNVRSVFRAVSSQTHDFDVMLTDDPQLIHAAERIILPGQSAIKDCMANLKARDLIEPLWDALNNKPFLAICIGPQVLLSHSEENDGIETLGYFPGKTRHFTSELSAEAIKACSIKIPHIGWNMVKQQSNTAEKHALWQGIPDNSYFYFVHSYFLKPDQADLIVGTTEHGLRFASAIAQDNVFGAQFHPEKSDLVGLRLLKNFTLWQP